tara:strand:+ start:101 stop:271 length:171 start_codon:yes stop_codon:yes gene_type:complete
MKTYVNVKNRPEEYLTTNIYYDSKLVGEYCDSASQLSFLAACATTSSLRDQPPRAE